MNICEEYKLKTTNFEFKHSAKHKFKIVNKSGLDYSFDLVTPDKKDLENLPEYDGENNYYVKNFFHFYQLMSFGIKLSFQEKKVQARMTRACTQ